MGASSDFAKRLLGIEARLDAKDTIGPEASVENRGQNTAVGVEPTDDARAVACGQGVLKDGLVRIKGLPAVLVLVLCKLRSPLEDELMRSAGTPVIREGTATSVRLATGTAWVKTVD